MRTGSARGALKAVALGGGTVVMTVVLGVGPGLGVRTAGGATPKALAQAKTELLRRSDMPKGWTSTGTVSPGTGGLPSESDLAPCLGVPVSVLNVNPPSINSPQFSSKNQVRSVAASISIFSSSSQARAQYAAIASPKAPGCFGAVFNGPAKSQLNSSFGHGLSAGNIAVTRLPAAYTPKGATGIALDFTVTSTNISAKGEIILLFAVKGSKAMELSLTSVQTPFPAALSKHLSSVQLSRL